MAYMLKAPFPYFGGKSAVADVVWRALGDPDHYIEPFFGSGAVLLARDNWQGKTETVNDKDGFVANVWRSIQSAPDEVARYCDWPVNHADLAARKKELIRNEERLLENLIDDPDWCDPRIAGFWVWAASCWIGSGLTSVGDGLGKRPHLGNKGQGICKTTDVYTWMVRLSERLRRVRVVCGEWNRVCGGDWQDKTWPSVGVFFDPPYGVADRADCYHHEDKSTVAADVMAWAAERGERSNYRIVIAGYEEHMPLVREHGWTAKRWKAKGGYGNQAKSESRGKANAHREMLYFSPHCNPHEAHLSLF